MLALAERMGAALQGSRRQQAFLMTKMDGRTKQEFNRQLERNAFCTPPPRL